MSDANAYTADTARIKGGIDQVHEISTAAQDMLRIFVSGVKQTRAGAAWTRASPKRPPRRRRRE